MQITRLFLAVMIAVACGLPTACASAPIQQRETARLSQLQNGMPVEDFRKIFPNAYLGGLSDDVVAWVLRGGEYAPFAPDTNFWTGRVTEYLHFYFRDNLLIQWGAPGDWERNFNITIRH